MRIFTKIWVVLFKKIFGDKVKDEEKNLIDFIHYKLEYLKDVGGSDKWKNTLDFAKNIVRI